MTGEEVCLYDMLACREQRAAIQNQYITRYQKPVLSFCMNIPGPIKTNPLIRTAFELGKEEIYLAFQKKSISVVDYMEIHKKTGDELILVFDASANLVKKLTTSIEETHPLGRLFDIDILDEKGCKLSRPTFRKCLICNAQAQECASSRRHTVKEMQDKIEEMINNIVEVE